MILAREQAYASGGQQSKNMQAAPSEPFQKHTGYVHKPNLVVLAWLILSLPPIIWDTLYVLGRPYTMPGGKWHKPIWEPYDLYGRVDFIYGWPAWDGNDGFTAAQSIMNVVEYTIYCRYLFVVCRKMLASGSDLTNVVVSGKGVQGAVLLCFAASIMTVSKSILYWLIEFCSNFADIGHNDMWNLIVIWIIPNGLWILLPGYMIYVFAFDILYSMAGAEAEQEDKKSI